MENTKILKLIKQMMWVSLYRDENGEYFILHNIKDLKFQDEIRKGNPFLSGVLDTRDTKKQALLALRVEDEWIQYYKFCKKQAEEFHEDIREDVHNLFTTYLEMPQKDYRQISFAIRDTRKAGMKYYKARQKLKELENSPPK